MNHHHNELGVTLTGSNFRLEYEEDVPYTTKKIIDSTNKILDSKFGKLIKPEIKSPKKLTLQEQEELKNLKTLQEEAIHTALPDFLSFEDLFSKKDQDRINELQRTGGIQPTQTNETLKESINDVKMHYGGDKNNASLLSIELDKKTTTLNNLKEILNIKPDDWATNNAIKKTQVKIDELKETIKKLGGKKEYTSQALINTKIAALKEIAKKYPRSLIRGEVKSVYTHEGTSGAYDFLPFQKVPKVLLQEKLNDIKSMGDKLTSEAKDKAQSMSKDGKLSIDC